MAVFIAAPFLEPFENRVKAELGVCLKVAENRDVARIADLFGQVGRVIDELGAEVGVFLLLRQKSKVHGHTCFAQGVVDEPGVAGFIAGHQLEQLRDVIVVAAPLHLFVQHTARELGSTRGHQKSMNSFLSIGSIPSQST